MKILSAILPNRSIGQLYSKAKSLKTVKKPISANILKSYYPTAEAKLNDIYLDRLKNKLPTNVVEHNLTEFNKLPKVIKDAIKPTDIAQNGHISQTQIDRLWEAGKAARKPGVYGPSPKFRGLPEEKVLDLEQMESCPDLSFGVSDFDSISQPDFVDELSSNDDLFSDAIPDFADELSNNIDLFSDATSDLSEHGAELLENLLDLLG